MPTFWLDPDGDGATTEWSPSTGTDHYACVDDGTRPPTGGNDDGDNINDSTDGHQDILSFETINGVESLTDVEAHVRASAVSGNDIEAEAYLGGSWQTAKSLSPGASPGWVSVSWSGSWGQSDLDALKVRYTNKANVAGAQVIEVAACKITYTSTFASQITVI